MECKRLIARLNIKAPNLIKGINLEGLRVIGNPAQYAEEYYHQGADELIYMDIVASLYGRSHIFDLVEETAKTIFVPLTVGGGIRTIKDVEKMLKCGADKIAINTAALRNPEIITQVAERFGSQCMVLSIEAKRGSQNNGWEAYYDNGREHSGKDVLAWCQQAEQLGAGEILLTSVDKEGTRKGFDIDLIEKVSNQVSIPVIACGGCGHAEHLVQAFKEGRADAVAVADILHYEREKISPLKQHLLENGITVRQA